MLLTVPEWLRMSVQRKCGTIGNMAVRTLQLAVRVWLISLKVPKPEIQIRIHTSDKWIRIWILDAQKHMDPVDPDPDSDRDPQHC